MCFLESAHTDVEASVEHVSLVRRYKPRLPVIQSEERLGFQPFAFQGFSEKNRWLQVVLDQAGDTFYFENVHVDLVLNLMLGLFQTMSPLLCCCWSALTSLTCCVKATLVAVSALTHLASFSPLSMSVTWNHLNHFTANRSASFAMHDFLLLHYTPSYCSILNAQTQGNKDGVIIK